MGQAHDRTELADRPAPEVLQQGDERRIVRGAVRRDGTIGEPIAERERGRAEDVRASLIYMRHSYNLPDRTLRRPLVGRWRPQGEPRPPLPGREEYGELMTPEKVDTWAG